MNKERSDEGLEDPIETWQANVYWVATSPDATAEHIAEIEGRTVGALACTGFLPVKRTKQVSQAAVGACLHRAPQKHADQNAEL